MNTTAQKISLKQWDQLHSFYISQNRCARLKPISHFLSQGDCILEQLWFDNSPAALALWNLLLTEKQRLFQAHKNGTNIIAAMKDLGTVSAMANSLQNTIAFAPDGAWWIPCFMQNTDKLLAEADKLGLDESFCPVRAMAGAYLTGGHFPPPALTICSCGAVCDDVSVISQRINALGFELLWWEIPQSRCPDPGQAALKLSTGQAVPAQQVSFVAGQLEKVRSALAKITRTDITDEVLAAGIDKANVIRAKIRQLRDMVFSAPICPMPALEMLIVEMLAIHYCSSYRRSMDVLDQMLEEVRRRIRQNRGVLSADAVPIFWLNPPADIRFINILEQCGGRVCGTEYMVTHAFAQIPTAMKPLHALALTALSDPLVCSTQDRAQLILDQIKKYDCRAVVISNIPGASHCPAQGTVISEIIRKNKQLNVVEIEIGPTADSTMANITTKLQALIEIAGERKHKCTVQE